MSNSSLVSYTKISPNRNSPRNHVIDTITIHCMAGQLSVETCANVFATSKAQASSNYGVGPDGRIGMYVEEKDRSWASSNAANDHRAITIEVASDKSHPYAVTNAAYQATIKLCADICKRNNIKKLVWSTDKNTRVNHLNGCNMTVHRDFSAKSCPGDYLYNRMADIAAQVNKLLNTNNTSGISSQVSNMLNTNALATSKVTPGCVVKILADVLNIRKEPNAVSNIVGSIKQGGSYTIVEVKGSWGKLKSGAGWINCSPEYVKVVGASGSSSVSVVVTIIADVLNIRKEPSTSSAKVGTVKRGQKYTIVQFQGEWGKLKSGAGWINCNSAYVKK